MSRISLYRLAQWVSTHLPPEGCLRLAEWLADCHCQQSSRDRATVQGNLTRVLNRKVDDGSPMVREVFRNFARYLAEFLSAHRFLQSRIRLEGTQQLCSAIPKRQGGIILSAHLGNWELGAMAIHRLGFPFSVVALPHQDPWVDEFFNDQRLRCGVKVIPLGRQATSRCLGLLRAGELLGILGDREFSDNGIAVPCFGRRVIVPRGPAILSLRTGSPLIPVFLIREGPWRFRFHVEPLIWPPSGPWDEPQVEQLTCAYVTVIERYVRQFPTQWLMFYPIPEESPTEHAGCGAQGAE